MGMPTAANRTLDAPEEPGAGFASLKDRLKKTVEHFKRLHDQPESTKEKRLIQIILDALHFISSTGQYGSFSDYLNHVEAGAPPYVVASFATHGEAEAWLRHHPNPPVSANVLIANSYHDVVHDRDTGFRQLPRNRDLEYYLAELKREDPPVAAASFGSINEAEAWMQSQPDPARWAWVSVGGEYYVAAYYSNIKYRALYPLSLAEGHDVECIGESH